MTFSLAVLTVLLFRIANLMSFFNILQLAFASRINLWLILCKCGAQIQQIAGGSDMKLRVSLDNLLAAEQVGRWWIVGSSWSGAPMINKEGNETSKHSTAEGQVVRVFFFLLVGLLVSVKYLMCILALSSIFNLTVVLFISV